MFTPAAVLCLQQGCAWAGGALKAACKGFCHANLWQTPQGRTCRWKYSDKLSCSYLEFKRLKKQPWGKRGIFLKKETLKGLGGFFSQLLLGDSCCSAIFFLCLALMNSDFFSLNFIPFEHELGTVGAVGSWWWKEQVMHRVWLGFWYCRFFITSYQVYSQWRI